MTGKSRNPFHFWHELRERKVVRVITVYTASAFAILQAVDMIFPRLGFPAWTVTLSMILLAAGLVIAVILSWLYDITPEGIVKSGESNENPVIQTDLPHRESGTESEVDQLETRNKMYADRISRYRKKEKFYSISSVVVILGVVILFLFSSGKAIPFTKRDWIMISDFDNLTGNPVFSKSLNTAFSLAVNQSRHVNVFPKSRMLEALKRMNISNNDFLDERIAKEIAVREGINILVVPEISGVGDRYAITAKIIDTRSGNLFESVVLNADNQNDILDRLDKLSRTIRRDLGESRYRIAMQGKPLSKVTTSSLEALKQYSQAIECHWKLDFAGAKTYYENALRIDTGFTSAKASLGSLLIERFSDPGGVRLLSQAVKSLDNLTEKEKYSILSFYAVKVENDLKKGIEYARILTKLYPDDATYFNNAGYFSQLDGQYNEALEYYKAALRLDPSKVMTYSGVLWIYIQKTAEIDSARVWSEKMLADHPQHAWSYFYKGTVYACLDSLDQAVNFLLKAREINPYLIMNLYGLAHAYFALGLHKEAIVILEKIHEIDKNDVSVYYETGVNYQAMGNREEAGKNLQLFLDSASKRWMRDYPDLAETYISLGAASARLKDTVTAQKMLQKALSINPELPERYAVFYLLLGKIPEALRETEKALVRGTFDLYWLKRDIDMQQLQNDPRFRNLLKKYNI